jgi:archaetidylinositol phosphate synthase
MVLNQIRDRIRPIMDRLGRSVAKSGLSPNLLTAFGFLLALLSGFLFAYRPLEPYFAALSLVGSGFMDILDGAAARTSGKVSSVGSFNDSTLDRISEVAIFAGIIYAGYRVSPWIVLLTLAFSLLVSYVRAKGESLGITMSGIGVGERAERLIVLIVFSFAGFFWVGIGVYVILVLVLATFFQRYVYVVQMLQRKKGSTRQA